MQPDLTGAVDMQSVASFWGNDFSSCLNIGERVTEDLSSCRHAYPVDSLLMSARADVLTGDYIKAISKFDKIMEINPWATLTGLENLYMKELPRRRIESGRARKIESKRIDS